MKYRGIFLNDEAPALSGWAYEKFGGFNSQMYAHVFELILRLRGNFLWPAMWGRAFNADDPKNPALANEYGIVMGTSHHEPLMRAQAEWRGKGAWNYDTNAAVLRQFWADSLDRTKGFENIQTVGMRGDGDEPMSREANVALLERIVADQRKLIAGAPEPGRDQGAAGVGALQGSAGVLREGHARARRRHPAVVATTTGATSAACRRPRSAAAAAAPASTTTSTTSAARATTSG